MARSAVTWSARASAAAPNSTRVLSCPVRPNSAVSIAIAAAPIPAFVSRDSTLAHGYGRRRLESGCGGANHRRSP